MWPQTGRDRCIFMRRSFAAITLLLCLSSVGCIHKPANSTPITPWERVTADSAVLAQGNNSLERGTEAVVISKLLTPAQAEPIVAFTGQVATIHTQLTAILSKGILTAGSPDAVTLAALVAQVQASGTALVNSGALGIKNPNTQQTIAQDIQLLVTLSAALLNDAQAIESGAIQ